MTVYKPNKFTKMTISQLKLFQNRSRSKAREILICIRFIYSYFDSMSKTRFLAYSTFSINICCKNISKQWLQFGPSIVCCYNLIVKWIIGTCHLHRNGNSSFLWDKYHMCQISAEQFSNLWCWIPHLPHETTSLLSCSRL